ncbi:MAG: chitobiase/beta-hexosaminidase C-terminal domain-containing protein [Marinilabiliaceae bacterium]|nr:chitobiase/beta-hexosaminidase C-terminal domain-containing protein [Marinilabiliaceae bacterium]
MKKKILTLVLLMSLLMTNNAQILPVKVCIQEQDQWCWAGVSQCVLDYYGCEVEQCEIADYARTVITWHNFGSVPCCDLPYGPCNYWNYNWGYPGSIQDILVNFAELNNYGIGSYLSHQSVIQELNENRLFIIRWGWTYGGGHFVVGHGIEDQTLYYMDPWFGEGAKFADYNWVVNSSDHSWTHTNAIYEMVSKPTFDPIPGIYETPQNVTINCETPDAVIFYTLDGSNPNDNSEIFTTPILLSEGTSIIKAMAVYPGFNNSAVVVGEYTVNVGIRFFTLTDIEVYSFNNQIYIINEKNINLKSVQIIDLLGRVIYKDKVNSSTTISINVDNGHYIVRLISEDGKVSNTKVYLTRQHN